MPCLSFTSTMKRVPNSRDWVPARIDNTRRSSLAETNPSSYDSSIDTFRSPPPILGSPRQRVLRASPPRGGSQSPEARNRQHGPGTTASMNFVRYARTLITSRHSLFRAWCIVASLDGLFLHCKYCREVSWRQTISWFSLIVDEMLTIGDKNRLTMRNSCLRLRNCYVKTNIILTLNSASFKSINRLICIKKMIDKICINNDR